MWSGSFYNRKFPFWPFFNCSGNFFLPPSRFPSFPSVRPEYKTVWMKWKFFMKRKKKVSSVCPRRFESLFVGLLCLFSSLSFHFGHVARLGVGGEKGEKMLKVHPARVDRCTEGSESFSPDWASILSGKSFRKFPRKLLASKFLSSVHPFQKLSSQLHLGNFHFSLSYQTEMCSPHFASPQSSTPGQDSCTSFISSILWSLSHDDNKLFLPFFLQKVYLIPRTEWIAIHWIDSFSSSLAAAVNKIE